MRRRVVCEWRNGNRTVTPWYHANDNRLTQFFRRIDEMLWMRVEAQA